MEVPCPIKKMMMINTLSAHEQKITSHRHRTCSCYDCNSFPVLKKMKIWLYLSNFIAIQVGDYQPLCYSNLWFCLSNLHEDLYWAFSSSLSNSQYFIAATSPYLPVHHLSSVYEMWSPNFLCGGDEGQLSDTYLTQLFITATDFCLWAHTVFEFIVLKRSIRYAKVDVARSFAW